MTQALDQIDMGILNILQHDSTITVKEIAQKIGLSATPTYERIRHLEDKGIIRKYVALIDREKTGFQLMVYCNVTLKEQSRKALLDFEKAVSKLPEVMEIISLSGTYDYMLKIIARDIAAYNDFVVNKLSDIKNIGQYHSNIVMSIPKYETAYPL